MLHIDLHDDRTGLKIKVGNLEDFCDDFISEIGSVTLTFSNTTHRRKAKEALLRVFQRKVNEAH